MLKNEEYQKEIEKIQQIFLNVEPEIAKLADGLIEEAAYLKVENTELKKLMGITGMIKVHPNNPAIQKTTEAAKQYLKNVNSYAVIIKTLGSILNRNAAEGEDEFQKFLNEKNND